MRSASFTAASNDEDWLFPFGANIIAYSNTLSSVDDRITYEMIDAE